MHAKTLTAVAGASLGIAIGYLFVYATEIAVWSIIAGTLCLAIYAVERKREAKGLALSLFLFIFLFFLSLGIVRVQFESVAPPFVCGSCSFEGVVTQTPTTSDTYQTLMIRQKESGSLAIQVRAPLYPKYQAGEMLRLSGKVQIPSPSYSHGNANSFDYGSYLLTKNIGSEMMYPKVEVIDENAYELSYVLMRFKELLVSRITLYMSSPASLLGSGMLFGDSSMSKDLKQTFRASGLSHIVVLSGFNIAILISFALLLLAMVPLIVRVIFASLFVLMFLAMVGVEASILRAAFMAFISLLATLFGRTYIARQALFLSFFAICTYEPYSLLHDASLHLSFLATAGIVYLNDPLSKLLQSYVTKDSWRELMSTTLAAYVSTLPYIMYSFGSVSLYALFANLLALPLVPLAMLTTFLAVALSFISTWLAIVMGTIASVIGKIIISIAQTIEMLPYAYLGISISFAFMCVLYCMLIALGVYFTYRKENETVRTEEGYLTDVLSY